jgi:hypothetical protein
VLLVYYLGRGRPVAPCRSAPCGFTTALTGVDLYPWRIGLGSIPDSEPSLGYTPALRPTVTILNDQLGPGRQRAGRSPRDASRSLPRPLGRALSGSSAPGRRCTTACRRRPPRSDNGWPGGWQAPPSGRR